MSSPFLKTCWLRIIFKHGKILNTLLSFRLVQGLHNIDRKSRPPLFLPPAMCQWICGQMSVCLALCTSFLTNLVLTKASTATLRTQFRCCFSTPKEASGRDRLVINWQLARFAFRTWSSFFNHWFLRINHFKNLTAGKVMHIVEVVSKNHIE